MRFLFFGALSGFLSVALGAFAAHGLKQVLDPAALTTFETGVRYQLAHALALLVVGLLPASTRGRTTAGVAFLLGSLLFCGSLYGLAVTGWRGFGPITPFGGVAFLVGWAALARAGFDLEKNRDRDR